MEKLGIREKSLGKGERTDRAKQGNLQHDQADQDLQDREAASPAHDTHPPGHRRTARPYAETTSWTSSCPRLSGSCPNRS